MQFQIELQQPINYSFISKRNGTNQHNSTTLFGALYIFFFNLKQDAKETFHVILNSEFSLLEVSHVGSTSSQITTANTLKVLLRFFELIIHVEWLTMKVSAGSWAI